MKRFTFRLDRVLELRQQAERDRARFLAEAREQERRARQVSEASTARFAEAVAQFAATPMELRTAGTLRNLTLALEAAKAGAAAAAAAHHETVVRLETELVTFEQARQARRAIERLREQRRAQWEQELGRTEQQLLDEVAQRMTITERPA